MRLFSFLLALSLAAPAGAQYRSTAVGEARPVSLAVMPAAPILPTAGSAILPSIAPSLSAPSLAAAPAAAPVAAPVAAVAPAPTAVQAVSALASQKDEPAASAGEAAAKAFDGGKQLSVLMTAAESVPYIKTGGLADVVDAVARGLVERGHRVTMVLPKYRQLKTNGLDLKKAGTVSVPMAGRVETAQLWTADVRGVKVILLDHPYYDRPGGPYDSGSVYGVDENEERFAFYARASLEAAKALGFKPDIVSAHDWHAGLVPAYLKLVYGADPFFAATRSVVTIHNMAYQGWYPQTTAEKIGFSAEDAEKGAPLAHGDGISYLKAGLQLADAVTTVSPTYAREIVEKPEFGMGLEDVLNARPDGVSGILNGVDPALNDPRTDPDAPVSYGVSDVAEGKAANKAWLQERLGLAAEPQTPVFAVASRLAHQKGIDLVLDAVKRIVGLGGQVVITGSGDKELEARVAELAASYPGRVGRHAFDEVFVHAIYAGADFLLMPSRFEPCGLSQLIAQRYGTLPIVTRTGGLVDTVKDLRRDQHQGDGLHVRDFTVQSLVEAVADAIAGYRDPEALASARRRAMEKDSSWGPALEQYEALFRALLARPASRAASSRPASADSASSTSSASDARRDGSTAE